MRKLILLFGWIFAVMIAPLVMAVESAQLPIYDGFSNPLPWSVFIQSKCRDVDKCSKDENNSYTLNSAVGNLGTIFPGKQKLIILKPSKSWISQVIPISKGEIHSTDKTVNSGFAKA